VSFVKITVELAEISRKRFVGSRLCGGLAIRNYIIIDKHQSYDLMIHGRLYKITLTLYMPLSGVRVTSGVQASF
jgi:hypothetical protein